MNLDTETWSQELREFIADCRRTRPLRPRADLREDEERQCRIIGRGFISWLNEYGPHLLRERAILADSENWDKDPIVVFTSEESGLVAANEILDGDLSKILYLYPDELKSWHALRPDKEYLYHVHTWSCFIPLGKDVLREARKKYPISKHESYWLHDEGTICGQNFGRGGSHLWKWDGEKPKLLEEAISQWVS